MTLVRYDLGMSGNQDRAAGPETAADWGVCVMQDLRPQIDAAVKRIKTTPVEAGDLALERRMRLIGVVARTVKAVIALAGKTPRGGGTQQEDEMKHRDDSPENLERLRARVDADVDRLSAMLEQKGMVVPAGEWPVARPDGDPLRAA